MSKIILFLFIITSVLFSSTYYEYGKKVELTPHIQTKSQQFKIQNKNITLQYYKSKNGRVVGVDNTIIAKCLPDKDCESVMKKHEDISYKSISKDTYLITVSNQDLLFTKSVELYEEGCFVYAHPNFYRTRELR